MEFSRYEVNKIADEIVHTVKEAFEEVNGDEVIIHESSKKPGPRYFFEKNVEKYIIVELYSDSQGYVYVNKYSYKTEDSEVTTKFNINRALMNDKYSSVDELVDDVCKNVADSIWGYLKLDY